MHSARKLCYRETFSLSPVAFHGTLGLVALEHDFETRRIQRELGEAGDDWGSQLSAVSGTGNPS